MSGICAKHLIGHHEECPSCKWEEKKIRQNIILLGMIGGFVRENDLKLNEIINNYDVEMIKKWKEKLFGNDAMLMEQIKEISNELYDEMLLISEKE